MKFFRANGNKQMKQMIRNKHDMDTKPNWQETDQLAIYKRDQEELNSGLPRTTWPPATSSVLVLCDLNGKIHTYNTMSVVLTTPKFKLKTEADELLFFVCIERRCGVHFIQFSLESEKIRNPRVSWQGLPLGFRNKYSS